MTHKELVIRDKLLKGIHISYNNLLARRQAEDEVLYFSRNGKIIERKARELTPVDINTHIKQR